MRTLMVFAAAAAVAVGAAGAAAAARETPEVAFAKLLAGKVAEKPVACINTRRGQAQLTAYGDKLAYRISDKLVYVSDTAGGCERVARGDALITRQYQTQLCRGDIAQTVDLVARIPTGSCAFGDFTPYRAP